MRYLLFLFTGLLAQPAYAMVVPFGLGVGAVSGSTLGNQCVVQDTLDTGTPSYTQDIVCPESGWGTPSGALLLISNATQDFDSGVADHAVFMIGFADGTRSNSVTFQAEDGQASSDTDRSQDDIFELITAGSTTVDWAATAAMISDGIRLTVTDSPGGNWIIVVVLFKGGSWYTGSWNGDGTLNNSVDVTDPGFEPDIVFVTNNRISNCIGQTAQDSSIGFGFAINPDIQTFQGSTVWYENSDAGTTTSVEHTSILYAGNTVTHGTNDAKMEIESFDASGFSATTRVSTTAADNCFYYLAGTLNGGTAWGGNIDTPTATGGENITSPSFQPTFLLFISGLNETADTWNNTLTGMMSISVSDGTRTYAMTWSSEDAATTSNSKAFMDDVIIHATDDAGSELLKATLDGFDSSGADLTWSAVHTSAKKRLALFVN